MREQIGDQLPPDIYMLNVGDVVNARTNQGREDVGNRRGRRSGAAPLAPPPRWNPCPRDLGVKGSQVQILWPDRVSAVQGRFSTSVGSGLVVVDLLTACAIARIAGSLSGSTGIWTWPRPRRSGLGAVSLSPLWSPFWQDASLRMG